MSTDKTGQLFEETAPTSSAIENELPTYRAISNRAVFSVICGILASFSFAELYFLVFAVLAVALGWMANIAIKRHPDRFTGRRLANVGIALGLVFGLTVITYTTIHNFILVRDASRFAKVYARVLKEGSLGDALLYREPSETRKAKTAESAEKEFEKLKARERGMAEMRMGPLLNLRKALARKDAQMHFVDIEAQGEDEGLTGRVHYFAAALFEIEGVPAKGGNATNQYALAIFKGVPQGRHYDWWVEDIKFPYQRETYKGEAKPVDDGHGHAPGGH